MCMHTCVCTCMCAHVWVCVLGKKCMAYTYITKCCRKYLTNSMKCMPSCRPPPPPAYKTILLLTGDRGVGKSVALAHWLQDFAEENPGIYLIHHFIGASPGDNDIATFLHCCTRDLRKHFLLTGWLLCVLHVGPDE